MVSVSFFVFYLGEFANQFGNEFRKQNASEIENGDIFSLGVKLNSLSSTINWSCIQAQKGEAVFFQKPNNSCPRAIFSKEVDLLNTAGDIRIRFIVGMPETLKRALIFFTLVEIALFFFYLQLMSKFQKQRSQHLENLNAIARQVAHDIRSPLTALDVVYSTSDLAEDRRKLARMAITRIKDIANNLVERNKIEAQKLREGKTNAARSYSLAPIIEEIVSEKRLQFRSADIVFETSNAELYAMLNPPDLKRVISNLINNAVEALPDQRGRVEVKLCKRDSDIVIEIADDGKGIPADILPELGLSLKSFGKEGTESGSGLGLFHARNVLRHIGGSIEIKSVLNLGTRVLLSLPCL